MQWHDKIESQLDIDWVQADVLEDIVHKIFEMDHWPQWISAVS